MKKIISVSIVFILILFVNAPDLFAQKWSIEIKCKLYRPKKNCKSGFWFCDCDGKGTIGNKVEISLSDGNDDEIDFKLILSEPRTDENGKLAEFFFAEEGEEITMKPDEILKAGYSSLTLLPNKYPVDYSTNKFGTVTIKGKLNK